MISVVTSVYRTGDYALELHRALRAAMEPRGEPWGLLVVDDGCPQSSGAAYEGLPDTQVLVLDTNVGQRTALVRGIARTLGDVVVLLDSDLQDRPEDVPALIDACRRSGGVVCAGRRGTYSGWVERTQARAFRRTRWLASGRRIPADAGIFLAGPGAAIRAAAAHESATADLLVALAATGSDLRTIPLQRSRRPGGRHGSHTPVHRVSAGWRSIRAASRLSRGSQP